MAEQKFSTVFESVFIQQGAEATKKAVVDLNLEYKQLSKALLEAAAASKTISAEEAKLQKGTMLSAEAYSELAKATLSSTKGQKAYAKAVGESAQLMKTGLETSKKEAEASISRMKSSKALILTEKMAKMSLEDMTKAQGSAERSVKSLELAQKKYQEAIKSKNAADITAAQDKLTGAFSRAERAQVKAISTTQILSQTYQKVTSGSAAWRNNLEKLYMTTVDYERALAMNSKEYNSLEKQLGKLKLTSEEYLAASQRMTQLEIDNNTLSKSRAQALKEQAIAMDRLTAASKRQAASDFTPRSIAYNTASITPRGQEKLPVGQRTRAARAMRVPSREDTYLLANLRRASVVSPQIAQLSYVMGAVTSASMLMTVGIVAAVAATVKLGSTAFKAAAELQKYDITLKALATHGWEVADQTEAATQALGKAVSQDMVNYAAGSIYALDKIAAGTEKLVGYGIDMRLVNQELEMLGNLALGDSQRLENLAIAYGQVFGQGKARAQEMYQFINAGIPIFELLAQKTGKTTDVIMDMTRKGEVSFEMVRELLKDITSETGRYHNLMQDIANMSFEGNWTKFLNETKLLMSNIGNNLLPTVTDLLLRVNETLAEGRKDRNRKSLIADWRSAQDYGTDYKKAHILDAYGSNVLQEMQAESERAKKVVPMAELLYEEQDARHFTVLAEDARKTQALISGTEYTPKVAEQPLIVRIEQLAQGIGKVTSSKALAEVNAADGIVSQLMDDFATWAQDTLGLARIDIQDALSSTVFKGRDIKGKSLSEITQTVKPKALDADMQAALFNEIARVAARRAQESKDDILPEDLDLAISRTLAIREGLELKGAGVSAGDDSVNDRSYLLQQYVDNLKEENEQMRELVPFYREYIKLRQMKDKDTSGEKPMEKTTAETLEDKARELYAQKGALAFLNSAYATIYARLSKISGVPEAPILEQLQNTLNSMERGDDYDDERALIELVLELAKSGTTIGEAATAIERINKALDTGPKKPATGTKAAIENAGNLEDLGAADAYKATAESFLMLKEYAAAHSEEEVESLLEMTAGLGNYQSELDKTIASTILLYQARKLAAAAGKDITGEPSVHSDVVARGNIDNAPTLGGYLGSAVSVGVLSLFEGSLDDKLEELSKAEEALAKLESSGTATQEALAVQRSEVERLSNAYAKLGVVAGITAGVLGKMTDVLATATFNAFADAMYDLGRSLADSDAEMDSMTERLKDWGREIVNQLPAILMQGAMAAFSAGVWPVGIALLAASLGSSFLNGYMGSKEDAKEEDDSQLRILENLQQQFELMIEQFRNNLLYLDVARQKYISDSQLAHVSAYADGESFGGTSLQHGIYRRPTFFNAYASGGTFNSVMAESGAEAVLPLRRNAAGQLGVIAGGASGATVNVIIEDHAGVQVASSSTENTSDGINLKLVLEQSVLGTLSSGKADGIMRSRYRVSAVGRN